jgi:hypothetical protein
MGVNSKKGLLMGRPIRLSILWLLFLWLPFMAFAQDDKAQKLFEEAELYYKAGKYEKAADLYTEAFVSSQLPDLLFNVAQCYRNLKKYEDTLKTLKQYMLSVSVSDEELAESVPGLKRIQSLLPDIEGENDFPAKNTTIKKLVKENKEIVASLLTRVASIPKPSALSITGSKEAIVYLDDVKLEGKTPLDILKAKKGGHKLLVKKEGYFTWSKGFDVIGDGKPISFLVELVPIVLEVQGTPEADVILNGELKGKVPFRLEGIKEGAYKVSVRLSGHKDFTSDVILPGTDQAPVIINAQLSPIVLAVEGPVDAELSIDGDLQGKLPLTVEKIALGKHKLSVKKEGFETWTSDVTITNDKILYQQKVELKPTPIKKIDGPKVAKTTGEGKSGASFALYGTSIVALGGGVVALVGSTKAKKDAIAILDLNQPSLIDLVDTLSKQSAQLGAVSVAAFAVAAGAGVGGFLLSKKTKTALNFSVTPNGVAFGGEF